MDIAEAFEIALNLATERLEELPVQHALREVFREALNLVEDFVVNQLGDDIVTPDDIATVEDRLNARLDALADAIQNTKPQIKKES